MREAGSQVIQRLPTLCTDLGEVAEGTGDTQHKIISNFITIAYAQTGGIRFRPYLS